jgi:catechol 2,3-dioxygenase-like lactoylglutathione lyase family enzyme
MKPHLACVSLLVRNYDEAIAYYTEALGFRVVEDTTLSLTKRWVVVQPRGGGCALLLALARGRRQLGAVGRQSGGRVFLFLQTDDFRRDHRAFQRRGVRFEEAPRRENYGTVAVFTDLYGNRWDLVGPSARPKQARRGRPRRNLR